MSVRIRVGHLDLDQTLGCGQTFRWTRSGPGEWSGPVGDALVSLRMEGDRLVADSRPAREDLTDRVAGYLRLGDDTERILRELSSDPVMTTA